MAAEHDFKGSNKSMRMSQAIYVNNLISDHFFTGLGYGYPIVHNMKYHGATDALYFESLYLDTISSSGYIGFLVWIFFFFLLIKKPILRVGINLIIIHCMGDTYCLSF